jgi:hypothetical protein
VRPDELLDEASAATGLDDFGPADFREGLDRYCDAVDAEARLNDLGAVAVSSAVVAALGNRLRVVDWHRRHPELADERVDAPVVVVGMFRAGTTLLSHLLDVDPGNRSLLRWEAGDSTPPPTPAEHRAGPRVDAARAGTEMLESLNPAIKAIHHEDADGPTECIAVMGQAFRSLSWEAIANVPSYGSWLLGADHRPAYEYHRSVLQVLQSGGVRGRWALKSPHHAIALDALTAVYPDARLVLLHRDPVVLSASVCSLIRTMTSTFSDADHGRYIAGRWPAMLEESVRRIDEFRRTRPDHPIIDVQYADLVRDPVGTVSSMYRSLGRELAPEAAAAIAAYVEARPKGAFGVHGYDLDDLGLDGGELAERFAGYVERYGIPTELAAR